LPVGAAGVPYEAQLEAIGGAPPYRWTALSELPVGITLATTGRLAGTPGRPGEYIFRDQVTDSTDQGISDRSLVFLSVEDASNFAIVAPSLPRLEFGQRFELVFDVEGGVQPYTWSLAPGSRLPNNTFFANGEGDRAQDGVLFGAPSETGTFGVGVQVEDGQGRTRTVEFALFVDRTIREEEGGCRCSSPGGPSVPSGLLLLLALGLWVTARRPSGGGNRSGAS